MSKDLGSLLRNGAADLAALLLSRHHLNAEQPPSDKKLRSKWAGALLFGLQDTADARLAGLTEAARRISGLAESRFDWMFVSTARPAGDAVWLRLNNLDRSIWFFLTDLETFEKIERRASYERLSGQKNKHSRFCVPAEVPVRMNDHAIGEFETAVQKLYRQHDGSGLHADTSPDKSQTPDGNPLHLITVALSQLPTAQPEFTEEGELDTRAVQRVTEVQASYEPATGNLFVTTTRGGYSMRFEIATEFAQIMLGLDRAPEVAEADQFDLGAVLAVADLPDVPGFEFEELHLAEAEFCHPDRASTVVSLRDGQGIDSALIETFGAGETPLRILSLTYRILCRPVGAQKAKWIRVKLNEDGSTSLKGDVKLDHELREKIPELWGLRQPGHD
jgi:hypothetical protein